MATTQNSGEEVTSIRFDIIGHLSVEIVENIFIYLPFEDLHSVTSSCLRWKAKVANNDHFWKRVCKRDNLFELEENNRSKLYTNLQKKYGYWQGIFWHNFTLLKNWETSNYRQKTYEIEVTDRPLTTFLDDDIFAYRYMDSTKLHVYNLELKEFKPFIFSMRENPDFDPRLSGREFIKSDKYLIHFISYQSLTVWNVEKGSTVYDQLCNFTHIHVDKNLIVLELWKEEFQVLNVETGQIEYAYNKEMANVDVMDGRIVFTTTNDVIHILQWVDKSEVTLLKCCNQRSYCKLMVKDDFLLSFCESSGNSETLCVWDIKTKTKLHSTVLENSYYLPRSFINKYLYLERKNKDRGCIHDLIEFWDYTKGTLVSTVQRLYSNSKSSNDNFMIACNSGKIGMWCFRTMDFICDAGLGLYTVKYIADLELTYGG